MDRPTPEELDEIRKTYAQEYGKKYDKIQMLIMTDDHIAEEITHIQWMSACIDTIVSCAVTCSMMDDKMSFEEREKMMVQGEERAIQILKMSFARGVKDLWAYYGTKNKGK